MKEQFILMNGFTFKPQTYYTVEVAMATHNPIFQDIFYTGFLTEDGMPNGYNKLLQANVEYNKIYYMKIMRELNTEIQNRHKSVKAVLELDYPELLV